MPTETAPAPAAAPAAASVPDTTTTSTPEPAKGGSFIENALAALSGGGDEPSNGHEPPTPQQPAVEPKTEPQQNSQTQDRDDEDAKAEADIKRETANMPASQRAAFTKLRYEARDLKRQLKAAMEEKQVAQTPAENTEANAELERLRGEYEAMKTKMADYENEAYVTRLESTEVFQKEVTQPRDSVATAISDIAKRYSEIDQDAVVAAVRSGDPDRVSRVTADMSEFDRYRFYQHVEKYHEINAREASLRENSKESLENIYRSQREQQQARAAEERTQWDKSISDVWRQLEEDFPVLANVDGDEDWNKKMESVRSFASPDRFEKLTVRERAEALHRAAAFPVLVTELEAALEELKTAQEKLSQYDSATPGVSSSGREPSSSMGFGNGGFVENALSEFRRLGAR
jgi:hypothetical protein